MTDGPGALPRWLGWAMAIPGVLLVLTMSFVIVIVALFADEPWGDVAGDFLMFWVLGVLAAIAGIRVLLAHRKAGPSKG